MVYRYVMDRLAGTDGAAAGTGVSVMASCTYPNHASFVTGVGPEHHRIHTNHVIRDGGVKGAWEVGPGLPTLFYRLSHVETAAVLGPTMIAVGVSTGSPLLLVAGIGIAVVVTSGSVRAALVVIRLVVCEDRARQKEQR